MTFFYRIVADAIVGSCRPVSLQGVAMFSKRAVLCGEDSKAHVFTSDTPACGDVLSGFGANRPRAVVEAVAPISLTEIPWKPNGFQGMFYYRLISRGMPFFWRLSSALKPIR